jgi:hypothetical protein
MDGGKGQQARQRTNDLVQVKYVNSTQARKRVE